MKKLLLLLLLCASPAMAVFYTGENIDLLGGTITGHATPTADADAATTAYVDGIANGVWTSSKGNATYTTGNVGVGTAGPKQDLTVARGGIRTRPLLLTEVGTLVDDSEGGDATSMNYAWDVYVEGDYAYVTAYTDDALTIIDVSDKTNPREVGWVRDVGSPAGSGTARGLNGAENLVVANDYAYVASWAGRSISIIDVRNKSHPVEVGYLNHTSFGGNATVLSSALGIALSGNYLYVGSSGSSGVSVIDVSDKTKPKEIATITHRGSGGTAKGLQGTWDLDIQGNHLYAAGNNGDSLSIIDISNPHSPREVGHINDTTLDGTALLLNSPRDVVVRGSYAYVTANADDGLTIINISDPANPIEVGYINDTEAGGTATTLDGAFSVELAGDYAFVYGSIDDGISVIDISDPTNPVEVGWVRDTESPEGDGTATGLDGVGYMHIQGNYLYVAAANDDALSIIDIGGLNMPAGEFSSLETGSAFVEQNMIVGNAVTVLGSLETGFFHSQGSGSFANGQVGTNDKGLGIGTTEPEESLHITKGIAKFQSDTLEELNAESGVAFPRGIEVRGDYAYVASFTAGMAVFDISNPDKPRWVNTGAVASQFPSHLDIQGNYLYVASLFLESKLSIFNITNPSVDNIVGSVDFGDSSNYVYVEVEGDYAYFSNEGDDAFHIVDISDPTNPVKMGNLTDDGGSTRLDQIAGMHVVYPYVYVTARNSDSFSIINVTDPMNPVLIRNVTATAGYDLDLATDVEVRGKYAYVATGNDDLTILNISDPTDITQMSNLALASITPQEIELAGDYAYISGASSIVKVDISNPYDPKLVAQLIDGTNAVNLSAVRDIDIQGRYLYAAVNTDQVLNVIDIGGVETPGLTAGSLQVDEINIKNELMTDGSVNVRGNVNVGQGLHGTGLVSARELKGQPYGWVGMRNDSRAANAVITFAEDSEITSKLYKMSFDTTNYEFDIEQSGVYKVFMNGLYGCAGTAALTVRILVDGSVQHQARPHCNSAVDHIQRNLVWIGQLTKGQTVSADVELNALSNRYWAQGSSMYVVRIG